jgi:quercetin dioxygenase-like cupin family protein
VVTEGACRVEAGAAALSLRAGESFVVPACVPAYAIEGDGLLFKATVPDPGRA